MNIPVPAKELDRLHGEIESLRKSLAEEKERNQVLNSKVLEAMRGSDSALKEARERADRAEKALAEEMKARGNDQLKIQLEQVKPLAENLYKAKKELNELFDCIDPLATHQEIFDEVLPGMHDAVKKLQAQAKELEISKAYGSHQRDERWIAVRKVEAQAKVIEAKNVAIRNLLWWGDITDGFTFRKTKDGINVDPSGMIAEARQALTNPNPAEDGSQGRQTMTELMQEAISAVKVYRLKTKGTLYMAEAFCIRLADEIKRMEDSAPLEITEAEIRGMKKALDCWGLDDNDALERMIVEAEKEAKGGDDE